MKIIDAHHHIWIPEQTHPDIGYRWLRDIGAIKPFGDPTPIQRDYRMEEFIEESKQHELVGSVFLQTDGALSNPVLETDWVASVFSDSSLMHGIVCFVDLDSHTTQSELLKHQACGMLRGVRQIVSRLDDQPSLSFARKHYLRSATWQDNLALLADQSLTFDLQLYPEQMLEAAQVFSRLPHLTVIVDHTGSPWNTTQLGFSQWCDGVTALAALPNCVMKLSGFGMFSRDWSAASVAPLLQHCLTQFGSHRMMFGSNFPVDKLMASYDDVVNRVATALSGLCEQQGMFAEQVLDDVFCNTAQRVYSLS